MRYYLVWYEKDDVDFVGRTLLRGVDEETVRNRFHLRPHQSAVACCPVDDSQVEWLNNAVSGVDVDLEHFAYFVECYAE